MKNTPPKRMAAVRAAASKKLLRGERRTDLGFEQCAALNGRGRRCNRLTNVEVQYFGNDETYSYDGPEPKWVRVPLCEKHRRTR